MFSFSFMKLVLLGKLASICLHSAVSHDVFSEESFGGSKGNFHQDQDSEDFDNGTGDKGDLSSEFHGPQGNKGLKDVKANRRHIFWPHPAMVGTPGNMNMYQHHVHYVPKPYPVVSVQYVPKPVPIPYPVPPQIQVSHIHVRPRSEYKRLISSKPPGFPYCKWK